MQRLLIILLSSCLALLALAPIRLRPTSPAPADPPGAEDTYGDEASEPCSDKVRPTLDNLDYFDWTYCSIGLQRIWRALNIKEDLFNTTTSLYEAASFFGDLDRDGYAERILRLTLRNDTDSKMRFVVMKYLPARVPDKWLTLAYFDISKFHLAPDARVVTGKRSSWLVLSNVERSWPPEPLQEDEEWFELRNGKLISVLSFPMDWDDGRQLHAESQLVDDSTTDRLKVVATISARSSNASPAESHTTVSFVRDSSSNEFVFDPLHSDIDQAAYQTIFQKQSRSGTTIPQ